MKYLQISVSDFQGVAEYSVDLRNTPYATIVGINGAGKSTIFVDAPLFAIFGRSAVRESLADVVRRGAETAKVELDFSIRGVEYRIVRTYSIRTKAGAMGLEFFRAGEPLTGATTTATQSMIDEVVGMTFDVMVIGGVMRQGESDKFAQASPAERLRLLGLLLGAERFRAARADLGALNRDAKAELQSLVEKRVELARLQEQAEGQRVELAGLQDQLATLNGDLRDAQDAKRREADGLAAMNEKANTWAREFDAVRNSLREKIREAEQAIRDRISRSKELRAQIHARVAVVDQHVANEARCKRELDALPDVAAIDAEMAELAERGKELRDREAEVAAQLRVLYAANEQIAGLESSTRAIEAEIKGLEKQTAALGLRPAECQMDHCGLIAGALQAKETIAKRQAEIEARQSEMINILSENGVDPKENESPKWAMSRALEALQEAHNALNVGETREAYSRLKERHKTASESKQKLEAELAETQAKLEELASLDPIEQPENMMDLELALASAGAEFRAELNELESRNAQRASEHATLIKETKAHLDAAEKAEAEINHKITGAKVFIGKIEGRLEQIAEQIAGIGDLDAQFAEVDRKVQIYAAAGGFLSLAPQLVIEQALPVIESTANEVLDQIEPGSRLEVRQWRETKAGETKDEVSVMALRDGYERPLSTFSGGERFRLDLALRLGIAAASGASVETLVIDEGWGSQDPESLEAVKQAVAELTQRFACVYTVSHVAAVEDTFGEIIRIK